MAIKLGKQLEWTKANSEEKAMLGDLQGNILDGHGRKSTRHLFLAFDDAAAGRDFLHELSGHVTSARRQLREAKAFRDHGRSGGPFVGVLLSAAGYAALDRTDKSPSDGDAFDAGMRARREILNDPSDEELEAPYREAIHAMILIGGNPNGSHSWRSDEVVATEQTITTLMGNRARIVVAETGRAIMRDNGTDASGIHKIEGIEHFGYVDGRSQPLMLQELIDREATESDGTSVWNPCFPIGQVLVADVGSPVSDGTAFGSYFVFRKLEQNVAAFKEHVEAELGDETGLGELAGAMIVGRFEDGTPVVLQRDDGADNPVMNNFDYAGDPGGVRCPMHAHIRKANPRGDTRRVLGTPDEEERSHIMARRGMTYGRRDHVIDPGDEPEGGVGLMFMAFHNSIARGFEFTQQRWANNVDFVAPGTGRDPVIGQRGGNAVAPLAIPRRWGGTGSPTFPAELPEFVRHRGGEYFFAPAKSTLATI